MSDKKNSWIKGNYNYFVDFAIFSLGITLTLLIMIITSDKFQSFIWINNHPILLLTCNVMVLISVALIKFYYEIKQKSIKQEIMSLKEENNFLNELIKRFKYQICGHLEEALFNSLKLFQLHTNAKYRVTVYTYTKGRFFSIGRFSPSPSYKEFGRIAIRDRNELLFQAWNNGELVQSLTPDPRRNMPSKKIAIKYLYVDDKLKDKFGVVVFETINEHDSKLKNGNLEKMTLSINKYFFEKMNIRQDLNFAMNEEL